MVVLRDITPGRPMRVEDDLKELGENTLAKLKEAIAQGDRELTLALTDCVFQGSKFMHDGMLDWIWSDLDWIARNYGEEEVPKALRRAMEVLNARHPSSGKPAPLDFVKVMADAMRNHLSGPDELGDFKICEEEERWVMSFDPCGSGGRMVRGPRDGSGSRLKPPYNLGKTTKAYPWAWGKIGVPYFCAHCCVGNEIMGIEKIGYPMKVTEYPVDDPSKPCIWYIYKDPNVIPEEYFTRVGFKKDPSRFKK